jgi:hypothetical protein
MQQHLIIDRKDEAEVTIRQCLREGVGWRVVTLSLTSHDGQLWLAAFLERENPEESRPRSGRGMS